MYVVAMADKKNWAERLAEQVQRFPLLVLLALASGIIGAAGTVYAAGQCTWDHYDDTFRWREQEYEKISKLRAGISIERFRELLGSPTFVRASQDGGLTESTFRGRDYWVQAIHNPTGSVVLLAVTSCDEAFRPTFEIPDRIEPKFSVTLNEMYLTDTAEAPSRVHYYVSGATANSYFYDEYGLGNPGNYKTFFVGIDDACPAREFDIDALTEGDRLTFYRSTSPMTLGPSISPDETPISDDDYRAIERFREGSQPNTYAEAFLVGTRQGEDISIDTVLANFQIGVNRLLVRTVP